VRFCKKNLTLAVSLVSSLTFSMASSGVSQAGELNRPWKDASKGLVLDAYEFNPLDWLEISKDKRIAGFIGKASDGLSPKYCSSKKKPTCTAKWRKYSVSKELYHTRRQLAKSLGMKWGAYHLGRAGNPVQQAAHFLDFAKPKPDEAIVIDIEAIAPGKFMSLSEAETFSKYIHKRIGRYPMLYTNHSTAQHIAAHADKYPLLSRLKLWYARYINDVTGVFPMGNWKKPALWQFAYYGNCRTSCPYRVKGTPKDIDVNASTLNIAALKKAWPFDGLVEKRVKKQPVQTPELLMVSNEPEDKTASVSPNITIQHNIGLAGVMPVRSKPFLASSSSRLNMKNALHVKTSVSIPSCNAVGYKETLGNLETC